MGQEASFEQKYNMNLFIISQGHSDLLPAFV